MHPRRLATLGWPAVTILTMLALALGFLGFSQHATARGASPLDLAYRTFQLFVLESGGVMPPVPWTLELARFLAPLLAAYATARAVLTLFRTQVDRARARCQRGHTIVCGLGVTGMALVQALRSRGQSVVAIERDEHRPQVRAARKSGVVVVIDDGADAAALRTAAIWRSRRLIACCDDITNAAIVRTAKTLSPNRTRGALDCVAFIDDSGAHAALREQEVLASSDRLRLELLNLHDCAARAIATRYVPRTAPGGSGPHVVVLGTSPSVDALVVAVASWHGERPDALPRVTVVGSEARQALDRLGAEHPGLDRRCEVIAEAPALDMSTLLRLEMFRSIDTSPAVVLVCMDDEIAGAVLAQRLWEDLPETERDKDRKAVGATPMLLARAGFKVWRRKAG
jgi:hypothetical protein